MGEQPFFASLSVLTGSSMLPPRAHPASDTDLGAIVIIYLTYTCHHTATQSGADPGLTVGWC